MESNTSKYISLHDWVRRHLGAPCICEHCGKSGLKERKIHWANKSGEYKRDLKDWIRLCVDCHFKYDGRAATRRECEVCNRVFRITPSRMESARYCSLVCRTKVMRGSQHPLWKKVKKITRVKCGICGGKFNIKTYRLALGFGKWCSRKCYYKSRTKRK